MEEKGLLSKVKALDWECTGADTQYLTHSIHRYSGKFIPQIGNQVILLLTEPGELVLDPYCGSGTVLLECSLAGRRSIGIDLNPLAVLISRVKTKPVEKAKLENFVHAMEAHANPLLKEPRLRLFGQSQVEPQDLRDRARRDPRWSDAWYRKWFKDEVRLELIAIHQQILTEPDQDCRDIALVAFSDILRKCSNANPSYPNVMFDRNRGKPPAATPEFIKKLRQIAWSVSELEARLVDMSIPHVVWGKAQRTGLDNCSVDAIITHPPYIGSIPYAEYGLLSLVWLGYDPKVIDEQLTGGRRQSSDVVQRFELELYEMFRESLRVLKPGRNLFMLLGNPVVRGTRVDLVEMAKNIASSVGFHFAAAQERKGTNRRANLMSRETLLFFRKN